MVRCFWLSAIFYSACMDVFNLFHFITRVTLCVSAVFAVASCCPSVRLSRWWIVSTRLKIYSKLLVQPVRPITVVFDPLRRYPIPRGSSSAGAQNTRGGKKLAIFDWNRRLYRKRCEMRPWLLWNVNRKS